QTRKVFSECLSAHRILDKERCKAFDESASANRVREVESLVKIDAEITILADAFARFHALLVKLTHFLTRIKSGIRWCVGRTHAERSITGRDGRRRAILQTHAGCDPWDYAAGVVAFTVIPSHAAQDFVNR